MRIGIIGGSGLGEALGAFGEGQTHLPETPFGPPSAPIVTTEVEGVPVALLSRHGEGHLLNPSAVPYRANIFALKALGVTHVLSSGAVGSLQEAIAPRDLVVPDQVIDRTYRRVPTFFEEAIHVELSEPFCPALRSVLLSAAKPSVQVHDGGTYVCIEGPQLSTRAESVLHQRAGAHVVGMSAMPEVRLAREAELCFAVVNLVTDYDSWRARPGQDSASPQLSDIVANFKAATERALELIRAAIPGVARAAQQPCRCQQALSLAIWSDRARISAQTRQALRPLLGKYLDVSG